MTNYEPAWNAAIAEVLRGARARRDMKQGELAEHVGVDQSQLSKMLRGKRDWRIIQVENACRALGLDVLEVFAEAAKIAELNREGFTLAAKRGDVEPDDQ